MEHCTGKLLLRSAVVRDGVHFWIHRAGDPACWTGGFATTVPIEFDSADRIELMDGRKGLIKIVHVRRGKKEGTVTVVFEVVGSLQ